MLAEMEPAEMDERLAAAELDGGQLERIAEILKLGFTALCRSWGGKQTPSNFDPKRPSAHDTRDETSRFGPTLTDTEGPVASPNQAAMIARTILGPPTNTR